MASKAISENTLSSSGDEISEVVTDRTKDIFRRLGAIYDKKWTSRFKCSDSESTKQAVFLSMLEWQEELKDIPDALIAYGFKRLSKEIQRNTVQKKDSWPPCAAEFVAYCQPRAIDFDLPSLDDAYKAAKLKNWSLHKAVGIAASYVSQECWDKGDAFSKPRFFKVYRRLIDVLASGGDLPEPNKVSAIEHQRPDEDEVKRRFAEINKALRR